MFSTKLGIYPRGVKLATKTYCHIKCDFNLQSSNHLQLACIYTLKKNQVPHVFGTINIADYNSIYQKSLKILKYSTIAKEIPPLEPEPPETEVFGSLGGLQYEKVELDEEELKEEERLKNIYGKVPRKFKPTPGQYAQMIKNYVSKGDLKSAENVIDECKLNNDKPTDYMYTLLINAFAIQGHIKKCYNYYADMKSRHYKIKANVYTSLFNACANSPDSEKALQYLERVREYMGKKEMPMNHAHYNCLVKAYGRHNKLEVSYKLIDEMMNKKMKIGISTLNSLMYAANTNIESGLKHVLHTWQLMRKLKVPPDIFSYNLLLRAIRHTHFGNCSVNELLLADKENSVILTDDNRPDLLLYPPILCSLPLENIHKTDKPKIQGLINSPSELPNSTDSKLIKKKPENTLPAEIAHLDLDAILKQNKLILFGGLQGLLEKMKTDRIEPNVKTLTYLIDLVPNSITAEEMVIKYANTNKIPLDIDFFNMLIKKRCSRGAKKEAKDVICHIHKADLRPNIVTYGVLALSCTTSNESRELLKTMKSTGHTLNKYVADVMLKNAFVKLDFPFILELMELMKYERVLLDEDTFEKLDEFKQKMTELVKTKHRYADTEKFKLGFSKFKMRYKSWQEDMGRTIVTEHVDKPQKKKS